MTEPIYFQDFLIESGMEQCAWCGDIKGLEELKALKVDEEEPEALICSGCLESYDRRHSS